MDTSLNLLDLQYSKKKKSEGKTKTIREDGFFPSKGLKKKS